jgi:hypothetical protein
MANDMPVIAEVWPVAADEAGVWLVSGPGAWTSDLPIQSDSDPHGEVELMLASRGAAFDTVLLHSTSWRTDVPRLVLTYMAVLNAGAAVRARWPQALPVSLEFADTVRPAPHAPTESPVVAEDAVLLHGLRHLAFLLETDVTSAGALDENWRRHLAGLRPALAGMYSEQHSAA